MLSIIGSVPKSSCCLYLKHSSLRKWTCNFKNFTTRPSSSKLSNDSFLLNIRKSTHFTHIDHLTTLTENSPNFDELVNQCGARHFIFGTLEDYLSPWEVFLSNNRQADKKVLWAVLNLNKPDGWPHLINIAGTLHGGAIATIIDGAAGVLFATAGYKGMTAYITTTFRKPIPLPSIVVCKASIDKIDNRKVYITVSITNGDEQFGFIDGQEQLVEYVRGDTLFVQFKKSESDDIAG